MEIELQNKRQLMLCSNISTNYITFYINSRKTEDKKWLSAMFFYSCKKYVYNFVLRIYENNNLRFTHSAVLLGDVGISAEE